MLVLNDAGGDRFAGIFSSFTELDSHANMVEVGRQAFVFSHSGQYANVQAFADEVEGLQKVPIDDAVIAYDCLSSGETYLLVVRNALCVPTMEINLIPPFILREAGLILNDVPKIHCDEPSVEDHSLYDEESGLRIPFTLNGTFSAFASRSLNEKEIESAKEYKSVFLAPDSNSWDPYNGLYRMNEDLYLDNS